MLNRVNTASQNINHHLGALQEKLRHGTDYEQALYYFLEEFVGDRQFIEQCEPAEALHLMAALTHVATKALGKPSALEQARAFHLPKLGFTHGNAAVAGRVLLFFYFDAIDTGLMALIPGVRGGTEIARFRLTGDLAADPTHN